MKWIFCLFSLLAGSVNTPAFTTYVQNGNYAKWDTSGNGYNANLVNPATHAIRFYISSDGYSAGNRTAELNAVRACFDQWQAVPGTSLRFEDGGLIGGPLDFKQDNTNVVFWCKSTAPSAAHDAVFNRRAYTQVYLDANNKILEADIALNGYQFQWFTDFNDSVNQAFFIEAALLHEIGHFIGLDHTPVGGGTVIISAPGVSTEAGLSSDEVGAARFLYPAAPANYATIRGTITMNGAGVFGAMVTAEDAAGNIAEGTVSRANGDYEFGGLVPGKYFVRVTPFDSSSANFSLMQASAIHADYTDANTSFLPVDNVPVQANAGGATTQNFSVAAGEPPFRITSVSRPNPISDRVDLDTVASKISVPVANYFVSVSGPKLPADGVLKVTGDGITMGPTVFKPNRYSGLNSLTAGISISASATPGLRSYVVHQGANLACANGYLEILSPFPDYNFDGLDDRFQRKYFPLFTSADAAPGADPDHDNFSNRFEFRTGSNPVDSHSFNFLINGFRVTPSTTSITWPSEAGKRYQVSSRAGFGSGASWSLVGTPVTASGETASLSERSGASSAAVKIYRLELLP